MTAGGFFSQYIDTYGTSNWKFKTHDTNVSMIKNHILPAFGGTRLKDVSPIMVENYFAELREKPTHQNNKYRKPGPPLSAKTRRNVFDILYNAMEYAVYPMCLIPANPVPMSCRPHVDIKEKTIWTVDDFRQALEELPFSLLHLGIHFAYASSCREGEMLALTEDCINLTKGMVHINKTLQRVTVDALMKKRDKGEILRTFPHKEGSNSRLILTVPKTKKSIRDIFLPSPLMEEIESALFRNKMNKRHFGEYYQDHGLLFAQDLGQPTSINLMSDWLESFIKNSAYDYPIVPFKNIRTASLTEKLVLSKGDVKAVQGDSGHSSAKTLVDWYAQIQEQNRQALTDRFRDFFYGEKEQLDNINSAPPDVVVSSVLENPALRQAVVSALFAQLAPDAEK